MARNNSRTIATYKGSITERLNNEALEQKKELEEMMKGDDVPDSLKQELTILYSINNLMLLTKQN
jgi:hypothetical protein